MPIAASDLHFRLTVKTGSAGNSTAQANPTDNTVGSLGGFTSTTDMSATALDNLFPDLTGAQNAASQVDYRAFDVYNAHATLTLQNAVVYLSADVTGGANVALGVDPAGPTAVTGTGTTQGTSIANGTTAPTGVTFTAYAAGTAIDTSARGLALGSIAAGQMKRVWVRRTATNSAAINADGATFAVTGDTAA